MSLFLALATADSSTMAIIFGSIGHHGAYGYQLYCLQKGQHKLGGTKYYLICLKPINSDIPSLNHPNYDLWTTVIPFAKETKQRFVHAN